MYGLLIEIFKYDLVEVEVMHSEYIEYILIDRGKTAIAVNSKSIMGYLRLTLDHFRGQGQVQSYFTNEYLENGDRKNITVAVK